MNYYEMSLKSRKSFLETTSIDNLYNIAYSYNDSLEHGSGGYTKEFLISLILNHEMKVPMMNRQEANTMTFERGSNYLINYGTFSKVATFVEAANGKNVFFDDNGEFVFTDGFLAKGTVIITPLDDDFYPDDED